MDESPIVYEIDLSKKYLLVFEENISPEQWRALKEMIFNWKTNDEPFLVLAGTKVKLLKVETDE